MPVDRELIKEIADRYQQNYSFMAVNATYRNAELFCKIGADQESLELKLVHDELIRRGAKQIMTKEEYDAGVIEFGVPPAFDKNL